MPFTDLKSMVLCAFNFKTPCFTYDHHCSGSCSAQPCLGACICISCCGTVIPHTVLFDTPSSMDNLMDELPKSIPKKYINLKLLYLLIFDRCDLIFHFP